MDYCTRVERCDHRYRAVGGTTPTVRIFEAPPPGSGVKTLNRSDVTDEISGWSHPNLVVLTNDVGLASPLKRTTEAPTKFVPSTVT
jgi:hypothetical protein